MLRHIQATPADIGDDNDNNDNNDNDMEEIGWIEVEFSLFRITIVDGPFFCNFSYRDLQMYKCTCANGDITPLSNINTLIVIKKVLRTACAAMTRDFVDSFDNRLPFKLLCHRPLPTPGVYEGMLRSCGLHSPSWLGV